MSISQNCRTCLSQCKLDSMVSLFVEIEKNGMLIKNADLLMECTSIKVAYEDDYPQSICLRCVNKLCTAYTFKKQCEYADKILKNGALICIESQNITNDSILTQTDKTETNIIDHDYLSVTKTRNNRSQIKKSRRGNHNSTYEFIKTNIGKKKILNDKVNIYGKEIHIPNTDEVNLNNEIHMDRETDSDTEVATKIENFNKKPFETKQTSNENKTPENKITNTELKTELTTELTTELKTEQQTELQTATIKDFDQENDETEYIFKFESKDVVTKLTQRTCNYCYIAAPSFKQMCAHVFKQHKVRVTFGCTDCGEHFFDDKLFRDHRNAKHSRFINNSEELNAVTDPYGHRWICCSTRFLNHQKLRSHVRSVHNTQLTYRCPVCHDKLQNLIELQRHMKDSKHNYVAPAKEHLCWLCGKQYILKTDFERHMRFHSGEKPYKCDDCGKTFTSHIYLYSHKSVHNKRSRKNCNICDKSYTSSSSLKYHMKLHTGVLDHPCSVCGRLFRTKREVREHMITHTGARDHECDFCGKKFGRKRNLMTHRKIHTGERPKVCHICGASFIQSTSLRLHMKKHENNLV